MSLLGEINYLGIENPLSTLEAQTQTTDWSCLQQKDAFYLFIFMGQTYKYYM